MVNDDSIISFLFKVDNFLTIDASAECINTICDAFQSNSTLTHFEMHRASEDGLGADHFNRIFDSLATPSKSNLKSYKFSSLILRFFLTNSLSSITSLDFSS